MHSMRSLELRLKVKLSYLTTAIINEVDTNYEYNSEMEYCEQVYM